ncbi:MAG: FimV/HubP family polar landmark protein [Mariprofundaceae bacterium]|nr:FimV/HubP family polar landmark protein [Mariprofundaceae bacterium]
MMKRIVRLKWTMWLAAIAWMLPYTAQAFSFGAPVIQSHLNEPLKIHLPIHLNQGEVLSHMFIALAKPDVYQQWGLQAYMDLSQLRLAVHQEKKAYPYVEIFSYEPMRMALISFILVAKKNQHHFYKQVKVMLDPASSHLKHYTQHEHVIRLQPKKPVSMEAAPVQKKEKPIRVNEKDWARIWRYGPVRSGDSLSTIAYRLRKDRRYSNHAVMLGLYRLNPEAFENGDMNHLKAGVFLNVPRAKTLHTLLSETAALDKAKLAPTVTHNNKESSNQQPEVKFVGHITSSIALNHTVPALNQAKLESDVVTVQKRLDSMYKKNMASHIRMDGMDLALNKVHKKIDTMGQQLKQINQDQLALQTQVNQLSEQNDNPWMWRWGLFLLFLLNALGLSFLYLYFKKTYKHFSDSTHTSQSLDSEAVEEVPNIPAPPVVTKGNTMDNHMYDFERAMDHQDYSLAETILNNMSDEQPNNIRLSALKVRFYHETNRANERDAYVHQCRKDLTEIQWRVFCDHLPSTLWQALVAAHVVSGLSYEEDMEERVRDIDDTVVVYHAPHRIVDKEESTRRFDTIEDIGFEGIPTVANEVMMDEKPSEQSLDSLEGQLSDEESIFADTHEAPLTMGEENLINLDEDHVSLANDIENMTFEDAGFHVQLDTSMNDVAQENTEVAEHESLSFEFDDTPLNMTDVSTDTEPLDFFNQEDRETHDKLFIEDEALFFQHDQQEEIGKEKT